TPCRHRARCGAGRVRRGQRGLGNRRRALGSRPDDLGQGVRDAGSRYRRRRGGHARSMRALVTGGTGNVGTAVVDELCRQPAVDEVIVAARRRPGSWQLPAKARFLTLDVGRDGLADVMAGVDAVVHLAWLFQPTHDPLTTWQVNAVGSARVFEAAATAGVGALVHASSVGAYSPGPGRVVDESWPTHSTPTAAYG